MILYMYNALNNFMNIDGRRIAQGKNKMREELSC